MVSHLLVAVCTDKSTMAVEAIAIRAVVLILHVLLRIFFVLEQFPAAVALPVIIVVAVSVGCALGVESDAAGVAMLAVRHVGRDDQVRIKSQSFLT